MVSRLDELTSCSEAEPLGQSRPREIGRVGIALDVDDPLVLDVDPLSTAHGAVRTDGFGHPVGGRDTRPELLGALGAGGPAQSERVTGELADQRRGESRAQ